MACIIFCNYVLVTIHLMNICWGILCVWHCVRCLWIFPCPLSLPSRYPTHTKTHRFLFRDVSYFPWISSNWQSLIYWRCSTAIWKVDAWPRTYLLLNNCLFHPYRSPNRFLDACRQELGFILLLSPLLGPEKEFNTCLLNESLVRRMSSGEWIC